MSGTGGPRVEGYCHHCADTVEVYRTVAWQGDFCAVCGSSEVELHR